MGLLRGTVVRRIVVALAALVCACALWIYADAAVAAAKTAPADAPTAAPAK